MTQTWFAVAYSYVQLWLFEVKFSPKNVNFTKSVVQPTSNFECRLSEIGKNVKLNQWFQYQSYYQSYSF